MSSCVRARLVKFDDTPREHDRASDVGMRQAEDVPDLVQRHGLDVERVGGGTDVPGVLGVIEVHGLGQRVGDNRASRREIRMREHAADHAVVRVVGRAPADEDVGIGVGCHLGEREVDDTGPGRERVAHAPELARSADVVGADVEGEREVAAIPGTHDIESMPLFMSFMPHRVVVIDSRVASSNAPVSGSACCRW